MEIKMTNAKAAQQLRSLRELESLETVLPAVAGFRVLQAVRGLSTALAPYEEMISKLAGKYSKDGKTVRQEDDPAAYEACVAELKELERVEICVNIEKIPFSMIEDRDLPIKAMFALNFMLE